MAKATSPAPKGATLVQTTNSVDSLLLQAGTAYASVTALTTQAAKLAAAELDPSKDLKTRLALVMSAHGTALDTAGHNVKAIFAAALALFAVPDTMVDVPAFDDAGKVIKNVTKKVKAAEAASMAKHTMLDAATQVRDANGIGRAKVAKVEPAAAQVAKEADDVLCNRVLSEMADALKVPGFADRMIKLLAVAGYECAPKRATVQGGTGAQVKATTMADLPKIVVTGAAAR